MRLKILIALMLLTLLAGLMPAFAQEGQPVPGFVVTTTADLRVRSAPTTSAPALQTIPQGTTVEVYGRDAGSGWVQVGYRGVVGWVSTAYLTWSGDLNTLPVVDATVPNPERREEQVAAPDGTIVESGTVVVFSAFNRVNIRRIAAYDTEFVGTLQPEERATVTLINSTREFGLVNVNGVVGWIALFEVNVLGDIRTVPVEGRDSTSAVPVPESATLTLEQREVVERVQTHLGEYLPGIDTLIGVLSLGASADPFIACGPEIPFFRQYTLPRRDRELLPEINAIVRDMNAGLRELSRARAGWLVACGPEKTLISPERFPTWLTIAQNGLATLQDAQQRLAALGAR